MKNKSILFVILLILAAAAHKGPALAQTPPQGGIPPQSGFQQPSQPQSQPQQPPSQQAPSQQQPQQQQMTPQQQQQMQQQYQQQNPQNQQFQQGSQPQYQQPGTGQFQQNGQVPNQQNFQPNQGQQPQPQQMTPEQQKQYQQYQQMTPQQQQQIQEQYKQQYQQVQQQYEQYREQWKQQAAQNGFQISTPPNAFQQQGQQGQNPNQGGAPQSGFALPSLNSFPTIQGQFFVGSANGALGINLNDKNTNVILGNDNSLKAKRPDGTEVEINKGAFEKINAAIKLETGSEISQNGNAYIMKRGEFEMETKFPISFNVATKTFSVQTPQGIKEVGVLPDQAVEKAIQSGVISNIAGVSTAQGGTSNAKIPMSEINNQPVYQIEGSSKKKMFGFFSVSISKTTFVSAENGNVVTTNQGIFSRFLDAISSK